MLFVLVFLYALSLEPHARPTCTSFSTVQIYSSRHARHPSILSSYSFRSYARMPGPQRQPKRAGGTRAQRVDSSSSGSGSVNARRGRGGAAKRGGRAAAARYEAPTWPGREVFVRGDVTSAALSSQLARTGVKSISFNEDVFFKECV
jgi:hypothetical protein